MGGEYDIVEPRADALIESLRSFGYTPEASIADLIDNSITGGARNIWIEFHWDGGRSLAAIADDGHGMSAEALMNAMRAGSRNPLEERAPDDLGRFGLGLKTASFAQCRNLTVASRESEGPVSVRRWDIDYVNETREWRLLHDPTLDAARFIDRLLPLGSGTVVVWERMDRIVDPDALSDGASVHNAFLERIERIESHVAMVFHNYMTGRGRVQIHVDGHRLAPWDPFLTDHPSTLILAEESHRIFRDEITVVPYVLPHQSRLTDDEHKRAAGPEGWNAQQGFYVYRNRRLIVAGSWLNFYRQEEHYKLARIRVDIPNSMDSQWDIDVRKARARPPDSIREDFRRIARITRERASEVFRRRGEIVRHTPAAASGRIWKSVKKATGITYRIDRTHPLVDQALQDPERRPSVEAMLRLIEESVPVQQIWIDAAESPDGHAHPFEGAPDADVRHVLEAVFDAMLEHGYAVPEALDHLAAMDPFVAYPDLIQALRGSRDRKR